MKVKSQNNRKLAKEQARQEKNESVTKDSLISILSGHNQKLDIIRMGIYNTMVASNYVNSLPILKELERITKLINDLDLATTDLVAGLQLTFNERN